MDELISMLKAYLDPDKSWSEPETNQLTMLLRFSGDKIIARRFPFTADSVTEVPARYQMLQVQIAAELYAKMGAEGQTAHSENGISRTWESADVARGLLEQIIPEACVP